MQKRKTADPVFPKDSFLSLECGTLLMNCLKRESGIKAKIGKKTAMLAAQLVTQRLNHYFSTRADWLAGESEVLTLGGSWNTKVNLDLSFRIFTPSTELGMGRRILRQMVRDVRTYLRSHKIETSSYRLELCRGEVRLVSRVVEVTVPPLQQAEVHA